MTRLIVHMRDGGQHVLDFSDEAGAKAALDEIMAALAKPDDSSPVTVAGRLVVIPADVRSAELSNPPAPLVA